MGTSGFSYLTAIFGRFSKCDLFHSCMCVVQRPVQCCAVVTDSTLVDAASATVVGKVPSATCQPTSVLTSTVEDMVSA